MQHITFIVSYNREIKRIHCASFGVLDEQREKELQLQTTYT